MFISYIILETEKMAVRKKNYVEKTKIMNKILNLYKRFLDTSQKRLYKLYLAGEQR